MDSASALSYQATVTTSARLHMGFFDLTANHSVSNSARVFGGLGLSIDAPCTQIKILPSKKLHIAVESGANVTKIIENLVKSFKLDCSVHVQILQSIPQHVGLGSGTQMALAIGTGLNQLFDLNLTLAQLAHATVRGKRSGIGIGAFAQGGFLLDAGKSIGKQCDEIPAISKRLAFPDDWRVLLVLDTHHKGVHGAAEIQAFQNLPPAKNTLRSMVVEHMLPALQRADLLAFGAYMADLQAYNGAYFAPIQGGRYASQDVAKVLVWLQQNGAACVGQSSWGPTGFAILENQQQSESLQTEAQLVFADMPNISFRIVRGKNTGASFSKSSITKASLCEVSHLES